MSRVRSPELPQNFPWLNTANPLSLSMLRGRVVILDFWTYCCINCLHLLRDLKYLEQKYKDSLTIIGVHSAKFDQEKDVENIRQAILRYNIEHPIIVDQDFYIWQQYTVKAWPTLVLIDPQGYYIGSVAGEGNREILDEILEKLIQKHQEKGTIQLSEISLILEKEKHPLNTPLAFPGKVLADAKQQHLFVADTGHHRLVVSTLEGEVLDTIGTGNPGLIDGSFEQAQFDSPQGLALDSETQILYVADTGNHALRQVDLNRKIVKTIAGTGEQSYQFEPHQGNGLETALNSPWDLVKVDHNIFIAMAGFHQIWVMDLNTQIIKTYAGRGAESNVDGDLLEAAFAQPSGITTDGKNLWIADSEISTIRVIGLGENATVRTLCGTSGLFQFGDQDGQGFEVKLQHCLGIEYAEMVVFIADTYNHKIKKVDVETGICQTILGNGTVGFKDGKGTQAQFSEPSGLSAIASFLYIADSNNHAIRRANLATLEVTTLQFKGLCTPDLCFPT